MKRKWAAEDDAALRAGYLAEPTEKLAARLGRSVPALHMRARALGLAHRRAFGPERRDRLRALHGGGFSDAEIAAALGTTRENVRYHRRRMALPDNRHHPRRVEARRREGLRLAAAFPSRWNARCAEDARRFARESGWPEGLRLREVQILNLLAAAGVPLSGREIAEGIGYQIHEGAGRHAHATMRSTTGGGSYLNSLIALGLVRRLVAAGPRRHLGRGRRVDLYNLGDAALAILVMRAKEAKDGHAVPDR